MKCRWNWTMWNLCSIVVAILKMATGRNFSMSGINISNFDDIGQCWIFAVLWWPFWKWWPVEIFQCRDIIIYPHIKFDDIGQCWIFPLMVTYHYVKFYVSIIIHLDVININVRNFKFPIGFYSNPHPLWTPKNMALTPFTTNLKTLGSTRNITQPSFMKFCPVVSEICHGHIHVARKKE
jgi:hypothetical protein